MATKIRTETKERPLAELLPWLFAPHVYEAAVEIKTQDGEGINTHLVIVQAGYPRREIHYQKRISGWAINLAVWVEEHDGGDKKRFVSLVYGVSIDDSVIEFWEGAATLERRWSSDAIDRERLGVINALKTQYEKATTK